MSAQALTLPVAQAVWRPKVNPWVIGITVSMAAFVEVLDTSVANVIDRNAGAASAIWAQ